MKTQLDLERRDLEACVRLARDGVETAWAELDQHIRRRVVSRLTLPPGVDREEVASETLADVWQALRSLRDDQKVLGFAATVARRVAARKRREGSRFLPLLGEPAGSADEEFAEKVEDAIDRTEIVDRLSSSLERADQRLFRLLYVAGKSTAEVEDELGVPGRLVRQRKHRLHHKLRRAARKELPDITREEWAREEWAHESASELPPLFD